MQKVKDLWIPTGFHGELAVSPGMDIEVAVREAIRKLYPAGRIIRDIKVCLKSREDGTDLVFYEILD